MHPPDDRAELSDYMAAQRLLGQRAQFALLDIEGETISASSSPFQRFGQQAWVQDIVSQSRETYAVVHSSAENELQLLLAVPVTYRALAEGVLVANIDFSAIQLDSALNEDLASLTFSFQDVN